MAETLMPAKADGLCGAGHGTRGSERTDRRNGYRTRELDTHDRRTRRGEVLITRIMTRLRVAFSGDLTSSWDIVTPPSKRAEGRPATLGKGGRRAA
ncbi:hypothetical protein Sme01_59990 [Sphaerisporangium melleum]|uniref:Uncharacterized protein n=1 Tax=Sphaerisporangium melleum TaxID=321316 RepID=A0A917RBN4_9ACTN|nr:hypothetical protein GCM10007964_46180 [Sphaerisporangium melleum]GII73523.1 hypothetical protein Sme01_59990 [Sphaerisporangium melleum]